MSSLSNFDAAPEPETSGAYGPLSLVPAVPGQLTVDSRVDPDTVTLVVAGELDIATARALERAIGQAETSRPRRVVLDLAALDFIDSTGIHLLLTAQRQLEANGRQLVLTQVPDRVLRLFGLIGMTRLLNA